MRTIDEDEARKVIWKAVHAAGSQKAFADAKGLSVAYVNDVVRERKMPSKAILDAVGLERVTLYRRKPEPRVSA
jgi:DNA-binding transcriptional regulator YdaS (Cro superfamily)